MDRPLVTRQQVDAAHGSPNNVSGLGAAVEGSPPPKRPPSCAYKAPRRSSSSAAGSPQPLPEPLQEPVGKPTPEASSPPAEPQTAVALNIKRNKFGSVAYEALRVPTMDELRQHVRDCYGRRGAVVACWSSALGRTRRRSTIS